MPALDPRLFAGLVWIVLCSLLVAILLWRRPAKLPSLKTAVAVALLLRLLPALILPRGAAYEMSVFQEAAEAVQAGQSVYLAKIAYPYLPLQLYWFAVADWLSETVGLFFIFWLKLPNILADTIIVALVYSAISYLRDGDQARFGAWVYALNPVTVLVAAYQGQFDAFPVMFLMLAWLYFAKRSIQLQGYLVLSGLCLGIAVLSKTWPVMFLPIVLLRLATWRRRILYAAFATAVPILGIVLFELLFPRSVGALLTRALRAGAIPGWWGYSAVLNVVTELAGSGRHFFLTSAQVGKYVSLGCGLLIIWLTRRRTAHESLLVTILVLFALIPNLGLQSLSWVVPFGILAAAYNALAWYEVSATIHMIVSYWGIHLTRGLYVFLPTRQADMIVQLSSLPAWIVIVLWLLQDLLATPLLPGVTYPAAKAALPPARESKRS